MSVYWIDLAMAGRLAIMARPRAGDWLRDEVASWRAAGVDLVVSLLERDEIVELGLEREEALCRRQGMEFIAFPISDRSVPSSTGEVMALVRSATTRIGQGHAVAVHCRAGIGRASVIAACVLASAGVDPRVAFDLIARARGVPVPDTQAQRDWVIAFAADVRG